MARDSTLDIMREILPFVLLSIVGELIAGSILGRQASFLELIPGVLVLLPAILNLRGVIATAFGARLGTGAHVGVISWDMGLNNDLKQNIYATLILSLTTSCILSLLAYFTSVILGVTGITFFDLFMITVVAGTIAGITQLFITITTALYSHKRGLDPDNITTPILATLGDIVSIICIFGAIRLVLWVKILANIL